MGRESIRLWLKTSPRVKKIVDLLIMNQLQTRPRWYVRMLAPFYQQRGRHSFIHRSVRMDTHQLMIKLMSFLFFRKLSSH